MESGYWVDWIADLDLGCSSPGRPEGWLKPGRVAGEVFIEKFREWRDACFRR